MKQTAQVIRSVSPGYAEVMVRRTSACASAHKCGSCDHCSMMENAPEIIVVAENPNGAQPVLLRSKAFQQTYFVV